MYLDHLKQLISCLDNIKNDNFEGKGSDTEFVDYPSHQELNQTLVSYNVPLSENLNELPKVYFESIFNKNLDTITGEDYNAIIETKEFKEIDQIYSEIVEQCKYIWMQQEAYYGAEYEQEQRDIKNSYLVGF